VQRLCRYGLAGYLNSTFIHNYFAIHKSFFQDVFADY